MREIEFRGKRTYNGEWVYGSYVKAKEHWHGRGKHEDWIFRNVLQNGGWIAVTGRYAVIPETVGQYTGLKDKNGVEIYEGDKVWCLAGERARGVWEYEKQLTVEYGWTYEMWEMMQCDEIEVIGNIHDNPELVGGAE